MSDIRINALATTATASASDDYVAIDGSANGTRKLSAYSPTFGGNLTVSGDASIGTNVFKIDSTNTRILLGLAAALQGDTLEIVSKANAGAISLFGRASDNQSAIAFRANGAATQKAFIQGGDLGIQLGGGSSIGLTIDSSKNATLAGNLTVSGTGTSSVAGNLAVGTTTVGSSRKAILISDAAEAYLLSELRIAVAANAYFDNGQNKYLGNGYSALAEMDGSTGNFNWYSAGNNSSGAGANLSFSPLMRLTQSGNFLVGTTTDGGQKLQVNGTITGYNTSGSTPTLLLNSNQTSTGITLKSSVGVAAERSWAITTNTTSYGDFQIRVGTSNTADPITSGTAALTLDSSQNATFAKTIKSGSGSGETLSAGSIDVGADIGIASTQGIVQGGARIVTFTSGNATFAGQITASGISHKLGAGGTGSANALLTLDGSSASNYGSYIVLQRNSTNKWQFGTYSGINGGASDDFLLYNPTAANEALKIAAATSNATFAGSIAINNTVQTAVSVASTHKVTISIGGSTYYLLATNV